jgi:hypothetical protein
MEMATTSAGCHLNLETKVADVNPNAIAWAYKVTINDAIYVALSEQVGYPLITADKVMMKKLKRHNVVVPLRELEIKK